jgi:hypothetical protein
MQPDDPTLLTSPEYICRAEWLELPGEEQSGWIPIPANQGFDGA